MRNMLRFAWPNMVSFGVALVFAMGGGVLTGPAEIAWIGAGLAWVGYAAFAVIYTSTRAHLRLALPHERAVWAIGAGMVAQLGWYGFWGAAMFENSCCL